MVIQPQHPKLDTLRIGIVATEPSGDVLGAELISALKKQTVRPLDFYGLGGRAMQSEGFKSYFPIDELAVIGAAAIIAALPRGYRLARRLVRHLKQAEIDALIIIDSPEFNQPVARWTRSEVANLRVFNLVAPTVWAWRSGRARKMMPYIDEVLAVLPFEPRVFSDLGGPPCTFIGHPAIDRAKRYSLSAGDFLRKHALKSDQPLFVMLPGSRKSEIRRHMAIFAESVNRFAQNIGDLQIVIPIHAQVKADVVAQLQKLHMKALLIEGEEDKWGAFRAADLALAASGTVTLELTATRTPMVVAYRLDRISSMMKWMVKIHSVVLPNLIMGENLVREFIDQACTPTAICAALSELYHSDENRQKQRDYLDRAAVKVGIRDQNSTGDRAAQVIFERLNLELKPE